MPYINDGTVKAGDDMTEQEFRKCVLRNEKRLYLIALSFYKVPFDAEDAVQNTFLKLWKNAGEFEDEIHMDKWLTKVCVNECRRTLSLRIKKPTVSMDSLNIAYYDKGPDLDLFYAVQRLPKNQRVVIHLFYYEDMSIKEMASLLKMKEGAVKTRLNRARKSLKNILGEDWYDA